MTNLRMQLRWASEQDLLQVYQLRHRVFVGEMGDRRYEAAPGEYRDSWDVPQRSKVAVAAVDDRIIGTLRVAYRREGPYFADAAYGWRELAERLQLPVADVLRRTLIVSRACVHPDYRRASVTTNLFHFMEQELPAKRFYVGATVAANSAGEQLMEACGFTNYHRGEAASGEQFRFWCRISVD